MSKLSAQELLEAARTAWGPSADVKRAVSAGIWARLRAEPTLGMDAPSPRAAASTSERSPSASLRISLGLAVVGLCVAVGIRAVGVRAVEEHRGSAPVAAMTAPAPTPSDPASPLQRPEPEAPLDPPSTAARAPSKTVAAPVVGRRAVASAQVAARDPGADSLAEEVALVRAAQQSLRAGAPGEALASLAAHASRFPSGALREERMTLQVLALCALGSIAEARSVRAELEHLAPASSHLQRLSCAAP